MYQQRLCISCEYTYITCLISHSLTTGVRMATSEPLPQRTMRESRRLRGQKPLSPREWSGAPPRPPLGGRPLAGATPLTPSTILGIYYCDYCVLCIESVVISDCVVVMCAGGECRDVVITILSD